jgi:hypothetical protein
MRTRLGDNNAVCKTLLQHMTRPSRRSRGRGATTTRKSAHSRGADSQPDWAATLTRDEAFKPLVVGAPRSGFALLASVLIHMMPLTRGRWTVQQEVVNALVEGADGIIAESILQEFAARGITDDVVYNRNFRRLTGGPKWLREDDTELACFRKYIGVRGMGDFTLVTSHPRQVLDSDEVVHSHTDPGLWLRHPGYADYTKFTSVRNPVGILNSSVFSINALASEYIQNFVPADRDNDLIRQQLALYKLTDLAFVRGLVQFLVGYLKDFVTHWRQYHVMRWEDLILTPVPTILRLAREAGIPLRRDQAERIWSLLDHRNLTGHHRHNYRAGKGIVGNWRDWLVNEHFELFEEMGVEPFMIELGYGSMPRLRESEYTPFQRQVRAALNRGEIIREVEDQDLFTFAFNKSNLSSEAFPFRRHPWRRWTRIERSIFTSEELELAIWDVAEQRTGEVNEMLLDFLGQEHGSISDMFDTLTRLEARYADLVALAPARMSHAFAQARDTLQRAAASGASEGGASVAVRYQQEPRLIDSIADANIVAFHDRFYGIPRALGEFHVDENTGRHPDIASGTTLGDVVSQVLERTGASRPVDATPPRDRPRLTFVEPIPEALAAACRQHLDEGGRRILLTPFNAVAHKVHQSIRADAEAAGAEILAGATDGQPLDDGIRAAGLDEADVIVVCEIEEPALSDRLTELVDVSAPVVAVTSSCFWAARPLFLISIPKAGTHLLYGLMKAMGYGEALYLQDDPAPGAWYCVEYSNSHTVARDFFVDSVRRSPFGNRHHPFMGSPAVFIYRNPLDIVASEAHYYHQEGKSAFAGYLSGLTADERLLRLIDDPWLLGSVRDRVGGFAPWLELPNVIPVSFEELVGPRGGGTAEAQRRAIWSIQLKLHVPGDPDTIAAQVFNPDSPTFEGGQIGRYRAAFTDEAYRRFRQLPQDFVERFGFEAADRDTVVTVPRRAEEFRRRPLRVGDVPTREPIAIQYGYLGFNIVRYDDMYFAIRQGMAVDIVTGDVDQLRRQGNLAEGRTAEEARRGAERLAIAPLVDARVAATEPPPSTPPASILSAPAEPDRAASLESQPQEAERQAGDADAAGLAPLPAAPAAEPTLVEEGYGGYNIVEYGGLFYAIAQELGPFDLTRTPLDAFMRRRLVMSALTRDQATLLVDSLTVEAHLASLEAARQQVASLEAQLVERSKLVDKHVLGLDQREQRIVEHEKQSAAMVAQVNQLVGQLKLEQQERVNQSRRYDRLHDSITTRDEQWREAVAARDATVAEARRETDERMRQFAALQQSFEDLSRTQEAEAVRLGAALNEARQILSARDTPIEGLRQQLDEREATLGDLRRQLGDREATLGELRHQIGDGEAALDASRAQLAQLEEDGRRNEASLLAAQVQATEQVGRLSASLRELTQRLNDRDTTLRERDAQVRTLSDETRRLEVSMREKDGQAIDRIGQLEAAVAELRHQLATRDASLGRSEAEVEHFAGELRRLEIDLRTRDVQTTTMTEWIASLQARLVKAEARPSRLRQWLGR